MGSVVFCLKKKTVHNFELFLILISYFSAAQLLSYPLKNKIPLEYMIVEVMFGELFRLPNPDFIELAYGSILIELCKLQPSTMPQVLAQVNIKVYVCICIWQIVCLVKMEYGWNFSISGLEITVKSCLEFFFEIPRCRTRMMVSRFIEITK